METVSRTLTVPIERPTDEVWRELRAIACQAARFGNRVLAGQYISRSGLLAELFERLGLDDRSAEARRQMENLLYGVASEELSGWTRNAMKRNRCEPQWRRAGKEILSGRQRLACFSADRALTIQADQSNNQGALYERDSDGAYVLICRFRPASTHLPIRLRLDLQGNRAKRDLFIAEAVEAIWSGAWKPGTVTIRFDRMRHKLDAAISYSRPATVSRTDGQAATLGPLDEYGQLWLRCDDGAAVDYSDRVRLLRERKQHQAGLVKRLSLAAGRRGRRGRYGKYRRKLDAVQSFGDWSQGVIHQWSRAIIGECERRQVRELLIRGVSDGDLPWDRLKQQLAYKGADSGVTVTDEAKSVPSVVRSKARKVRKDAQKVKRAREGLAAVNDLLRRAE